MIANPGAFWDDRFRSEGAIWGDSPSPTAVQAARYAHPADRVLDIGFGYGRDLVFLARQRCRVWGIDLSPTGRSLAEARLHGDGLRPEQLWIGPFEDSDVPPASFDLVVCHRMAHLLLTPDDIGRFARKAEEVLRPGGLLCLGARDPRDPNPADMVLIGDQVYEYIRRPGHRIRCWDEDTYRKAFGRAFSILSLVQTVEAETAAQPVPCHLTVMVARKRQSPAAAGPPSSAGDSKP